MFSTLIKEWKVLRQTVCARPTSRRMKSWLQATQCTDHPVLSDSWHVSPTFLRRYSHSPPHCHLLQIWASRLPKETPFKEDTFQCAVRFQPKRGYCFSAEEPWQRSLHPDHSTCIAEIQEHFLSEWWGWMPTGITRFQDNLEHPPSNSLTLPPLQHNLSNWRASENKGRCWGHRDFSGD